MITISELVQLSNAFEEAFGFLEGYKDKPALKILTSDNKEPKITIEVKIVIGGFFKVVKCSLDKIKSNLVILISKLSNEQISKTWKDWLVKKINEVYEDFQNIMKGLISLTSIDIGYSSEKIPLLNRIFEFKVTFNASKPS